MPRTEYNKLVRDKIPDIIAKNGGVAQVSTLTTGRYITALYKKVLEEFAELIDAVKAADAEETLSGSDAILEELADVTEVLHAIIRIHGLTPDAVDAKRLAKRHDRGGFEKRVYLEYVDEEEKK